MSITNGSSTNHLHIIELRSDTFTKPSIKMRESMMNAEVGDAVYDEDPTINKLQEYVAHLLGKESSLFFPSGTMCNLTAVMTHCYTRGCEVIIGDKCHYHMWEQGGISQIAGCYVKQIRNLTDGTFDLNELKEMISDDCDRACNKTQLICLENTQNYCGGRVLPLEFISQVSELCKEYNIKLHLDGSRVLNAAVASNQDPKEICKYFDSINLCLSKGVGAPVGSMLVGSKEFIDRAARARQVLGGAMRQSGVLAAAALVGLENYEQKLRQDHINAKLLAKGIQEHSNGLLQVDTQNIQTNIIHAAITNKQIDSKRLIQRCIQVSDDEERVLNGRYELRLGYIDRYNLRILTHCDVNTQDIQIAIQKIDYVTRELLSSLN